MGSEAQFSAFYTDHFSRICSVIVFDCHVREEFALLENITSLAKDIFAIQANTTFMSVWKSFAVLLFFAATCTYPTVPASKTRLPNWFRILHLNFIEESFTIFVFAESTFELWTFRRSNINWRLVLLLQDTFLFLLLWFTICTLRVLDCICHILMCFESNHPWSLVLSKHRIIDDILWARAAVITWPKDWHTKNQAIVLLWNRAETALIPKSIIPSIDALY